MDTVKENSHLLQLTKSDGCKKLCTDEKIETLYISYIVQHTYCITHLKFVFNINLKKSLQANYFKISIFQFLQF